MAFGLVVGKLIFGGAGRYLVNPAVLGIGFLVFSYSGILFGYGAWIPVPGFDEPTTVELALDEGGVPALLSVNYTWLLLFLGNQPGPIGVTFRVDTAPDGSTTIVIRNAEAHTTYLGRSCVSSFNRARDPAKVVTLSRGG